MAPDRGQSRGGTRGAVPRICTTTFDCLSLEMMFYAKGMKYGLRGPLLERYVRDMHRKFGVPRVSEPPPRLHHTAAARDEVRAESPQPPQRPRSHGRGRQLPLFPYDGGR